MNDLVSIIVPVYNVEKYLDECLDSLLKQTYQVLEIILVDDGSTDSSGNMCDKYAQTYDNIKVFHKSNGGLADARNYGLKKATGMYVCFVDSDDYVELDMIETLLTLINKHNVMLACARYKLVGDDPGYSLPKPNDVDELLTSEEMLKTIILGVDCKDRYASVSVWDRMYERALIADLQFPKGLHYEDVVYSTEVIIRAQKCAYINSALYNYRIRKGSISNKQGFDERILSDKLKLEKEQLSILVNNRMNSLVIMKKIRMKDDLLRLLLVCRDYKYKAPLKSEIRNLNVTFMDYIRSEYSMKQTLKFLCLRLVCFIRFGL